ncbi:MAG: 4Fe-4S dicluster domain-containing protein [Desulfovibrio sp.]|uniref:4Fe-4S dicluster domain-containing protein n=1 Tax=Desulfovibrio sp. 7SRBS1 TaxID=3378064 RepID=UPI003B3FBDCD
MAQLDEIKAAIKKALPDLDVVIGWERGFDALHATPLYMYEEADVDRLIWDASCVHNLVSFLPQLMANNEKKVGILVKGCDSRSIIQLLQEKLIERERLVIFGLPCQGVVSHAKVRRHVDVSTVATTDFGKGDLCLEIKDGELCIARDEAAADKCLSCRYPNPLIFDHMFGKPITPQETSQNQFARLEEFELMDQDKRFDFWKREMSRCIRCYACRNACPMCVCKEYCIAESRDPHWQSQEATVQEKWMFQMIHAMHLAGRCTECGECERACPMEIPLLLFKKKVNKEILGLFDYEAGIDEHATPPLYTFKVEEEKIEEGDI